MLHDILFALWFFLPAALANAAPIVVMNLPIVRRWNYPIDGGRTYRGKPLLGAHKTWRGLVSGIVASTIVFWLQQIAVAHYGWAQSVAGTVPYATLPTLILGPLFGIGALGGDAVKSFFKRRRGVRSGGTWIPFDQLDYIIGGALVSAPFVSITLVQYVWIAVVWLLIHLVTDYVAWKIGLKDEPI